MTASDETLPERSTAPPGPEVDNPSPADTGERARLRALRGYEVLDTPDEPAFDRLVELARAMFGTPIAEVSLIDEHRQWLKARVPDGPREAPRDWSFCTTTIQGDGVMVVPDARADPRLNQSPFVTGRPFIRFYAGAPLRTPEGYKLGTLCIVSTEPRERFDEEDRRRLQALADIVMDELELRRRRRGEVELVARFLETSSDCIKVLSLDGALEFMNGPGQVAMEVDDFDACQGQPWPGLMEEPARSQAEAALAEARAGRTARFEAQIATFKGTPRWWDVTVSPILGADGRPERLLAISRDVTERRQAEAERSRLVAVVEQSSDFIGLADPDGQAFYVNEAGRRLVGLPGLDAVRQTRVLDYFAPEDRAFVEEVILPTQAREGAWVGEFPFRRFDTGAKVPMHYSQFAIRGEAGAVIGVAAVARDMTGEKRQADALRDSERRLEAKASEFEALAENVSQLAWMAEPDGRIYWYNKRWYDYTGTTLEEMRGWGWRDVHPPELVEQVIAEVGANWARGEPWEGTYLLRGKDGVFRPFLTRVEPIRDEAGRLVRWFGTNTDVSAQREAEARLRELNETLEARVEQAMAERDRTWNNARDLLLVVGNDGVFRAVNPAWTSVLGWSAAELVGRSYLEFIHPDDHPSSEGALALASARELPTYENRYRHKDGSYRTISWVAAPEGELIYASGRDVTAERERQAELEIAQEALRQAQKMEAVGQLTGGLAHDFNNLLAGISGSLELIGMRLAQGRSGDVERYLAAAQGAARRAAALTHRLLAFSRRQTLDPRPTDANRLVAGMEELIRRTVGPAVAVEVVGASGLWPTLVDPNQLENALLNLCINARDAMPEGGRITIETANKWLDRAAARRHDLPEGQYVSLCVTDTGAGMAPEVQRRAFDPFFTTKPLGEGTGLGLSMVYGFARQSGGQVRIYSEVGQGTTVCIYLPRYLGEGVPEEAAAAATAQARSEQGETVLVVDDEPTVRMLVADVLGELGYGVIEAGDGAEGLKVLRSGARVDLLVTDVGLPGGMNGRQMADAAREVRPELQVLFITGYADNAAVGNGQLAPGMAVLTKPFAMDELAARVGEMVQASQKKG